jgi:hypothetical protein
MKWLVLDDDKYTHIVPETDVAPHGYTIDNKECELEGVLCPCNPKVRYENEKIIVIHNSFKEMEAVQLALKSIIICKH